MEITEIIQTSIEKILKFIGVNPEVKIDKSGDDVYSVNITGDDLNFLIGFRGQSLEALQSLVKLIVFRKTGQQFVLTLDINEYKSRKVENLQDLAKSFIDKVRFFEKEIELPRMNPWERREIHLFVEEYDDVISESIGEGEDRRVVLKPNKTHKKKPADVDKPGEKKTKKEKEPAASEGKPKEKKIKKEPIKKGKAKKEKGIIK